MPLSQISVRVDDELKQQADEAMKQAGTNPTQAITLLYQYIAENRKLPFSATTRFSSAEDQTRYLINQVRAIQEYCQVMFMVSPENKQSQSMSFSMRLAGHITSLHKELIYDAGELTGEEVASIMSVMDLLLSSTDRLLKHVQGTPEGQKTQHLLTQVSLDIRAIEQNHAIQR